MRKLVFLNRSYWPDSEATGQLLTDLCENLVDQFDVHVVCGQPNSPSDDQFVSVGTEQRNGVTIHRLKHTAFNKRIPAGRLLNLISFTRATDRFLRKCDLSPDVVISETDPFMLPVVAAKFAKRTKAKLVCYLQDIYPDVAEAIGKVKSGYVTNTIRANLKAAYDQADRVIVLGSCMKERLTGSPWSLDISKIEIIPNWADCENIKPVAREDNRLRKEWGVEDKFVVMHSGNMGLTQRLDVVIESTTSPEWPDDAVLLIVGDGASKKDLEQQAASLHSPPSRHQPSPATFEASKVRFLPYQPREKLAESLSAADLHVVSMHDNITGCLCPSKLYGILAAGRPVLAIAGEATDLSQTVLANRLGWHCHPGDTPAIAEAVSASCSNLKATSEIGTRAARLARTHFDRKVVNDRFTEFFDRIAEN